jgi:hypothetical protein
LEGRIANKRHYLNVVRIARTYGEYCIGKGIRAYPATYNSVASYLIAFVQSRGGSTRSIANTVSAIKMFGVLNDQAWLSDSDLARLRLATKQLSFEDNSTVRRKLPLTLTIIAKVIDSLHWQAGGEPLLIATTMLMAHNGLLRANEYLYGIQVKHITWQANSLTVWVPRTKTCRSGAGEVIHITDYRGKSAYKFMIKWFNWQQLWNKPNAFIIPGKCKGSTNQFDLQKPATSKWWDRVLSNSLNIIGLDSSLYSGHSFRAGGATDLFLQGVPYATVKRHGRWKSDTALIYLRDEIGVANTVANAFGNALEGTTYAVEVGY